VTGVPAVRDRRLEDLDGCLAVLHLVHAHDRYPLHWPEDASGWVAGRGALASWVAEDGATIVGQAALRPATGQPVPVWEAGTGLPAGRLGAVARLFVHPAYRRTGIGRQLLATAAAGAVERGLRPVLDVLTRSEDACRLYESAGWARIGELVWDMPDGSREPAFAYTLVP
jgi:GNAT superfamily N-acetyltransferase